MSILFRLYFTCLFLSTSIIGCSSLLGALEEEIEGNVREQVEARAAPGAVLPDPPAAAVEPTIELNTIQPMRGSTLGGDRVEILGFGFSGTVRVLFGILEVPPEDITLSDATRISVYTPPQSRAGAVTVRVIAEDETVALLERGFTYFDEVTLLSVSPAKGPVAGGHELILSGTGFIETSGNGNSNSNAVRFGGIVAASVSVVDDKTLRVVVPLLVRGQHTVTVNNLNGAGSITGAYSAYAPLSITQITPFAGPISGGTSVVVTGTGFLTGTTVTLGTVAHVVTLLGDAEQQMSIQTIPTLSEGAVDLIAHNENGDVTVPNGFVFYDPDPGKPPRVLSVNPAVALISPNKPVSFVVAGFTAPATLVVAFDGVTAVCEQLDSFTLSCIPPAHAEGKVDIVITHTLNTGGTEQVTLAQGFEYIDLRIDTIVSNRGSVAGGTYLTLHGNGFSNTTTVYFGDIAAASLIASSDLSKRDALLTSSNGQQLIVRSPPHSIGVVPISVVRDGLTLRVLDLYTYYDPTDRTYWATGDTIDGTINISVFAGRDPLANAYVFIGDQVDPVNEWKHGFTDLNGRLTLSGPAELLRGPHNIHVGKTGHGNFSWIDINSTELTARLTPDPEPPPDPLPECPQDGGGAPPLIRGHVYRIKDDFNLGNDIVRITTSKGFLGEQLPDPGPHAEILNQGEYELISRTGDMVVMAEAGTYDENGDFIVHALGFHPFVFTEASSGDICLSNEDCTTEGENCLTIDSAQMCLRAYTDIDIVIDTPLDTTLDIYLDDPPIKRTTNDTTATAEEASAFIWYDFDYLGIYELPLLNAPLTSHLQATMPYHMPLELDAKYHIIAGVYPTGPGSISESRLMGLTDVTQPLTLTPMLKTPFQALATPPGFDPAIGDITLTYTLERPDLPDPTVTGSRIEIYDQNFVVPCEGGMPMPQPTSQWVMLGPRALRNFILPAFPDAAAGANIPNGQHVWQAENFYSPAANFRHFDRFTMYDWQSHAGGAWLLDTSLPLTPTTETTQPAQ